MLGASGSTFTWLDYSDSDRRAAMDFLAKLGEKSTVDQLGIGTVRDALADILFPGTSTIQTRARYFLFVPWVYKRLEEHRLSGDKAEQRARDWEIKLILHLSENTDQSGLIGKQSKKGLRRLPSDIYWAGLATWGIRQFEGSQRQYFQRLKHFVDQASFLQHHRDLGEEMGLGSIYNWHSGLPEAPTGFPDTEIDLNLTAEEAEYLSERLFTAPYAKGSLLSELILKGQSIEGIPAPWLLPYANSLPEDHQTQLYHAHCFSLIANGARLYYEYLLARKQNHPEQEQFLDPLYLWAEEIALSGSKLRNWDRTEFWALVNRSNHNVSTARGFVDNWVDYLGDFELQIENLIANRAIERLITEREYQKKRALARLTNKRELERWNGTPGVEPLLFRWDNVKVLVADILSGLKAGEVANA